MAGFMNPSAAREQMCKLPRKGRTKSNGVHSIRTACIFIPRGVRKKAAYAATGLAAAPALSADADAGPVGYFSLGAVCPTALFQL